MEKPGPRGGRRVFTGIMSRATLHGRDGAGFGLVGLVGTLLVLGALVAIAVASVNTLSGGQSPSTDLPTSSAASGGGSGGGSGLGGEVGIAADLAAQQNLQAAVTAAQQVAITSGNSSAGLSTLQAAERGLRFVSGPSSDEETVSVAESAGVGGGGSVTLAVRSTSGTCWYAWVGAGTSWFGAEPDSKSCVAEPLSTAPSAGSPAPGVVGWRQGGFPAA